MTAHPAPSTDAVLRSALAGDGVARRVTLDPSFQGLPDTAHGGTVLALFDVVAGASGPRTLAGTYRRRVPLATPLGLAIAHESGATSLRLTDSATLLVDGVVTPADDETMPAPTRWTPPAADHLLPLSRTCFVCGIDNPLGLQARLAIDDNGVGGTWTPRPSLRVDGDQLATVAVTGLLDEAAFWLGAAASGEAGMTTELRVRVHGVLGAPRAVVVGGTRGAVRARAGDARYWETEAAAWDDDGRLLASARITFVAVRGSAKKLVAGLLAINPPDVIRRVFPAYVR